MIKIIIAMFVLMTGYAYAEPSDVTPEKPVESPLEWFRKPVQCGTHEEVKGGLKLVPVYPLMEMTGNVKLVKDTVTIPLKMYYNPETQFWTIIEYQRNGMACVIGIGEGVNFDVSPKVAM